MKNDYILDRTFNHVNLIDLNNDSFDADDKRRRVYQIGDIIVLVHKRFKERYIEYLNNEDKIDAVFLKSSTIMECISFTKEGWPKFLGYL